MIEQLWTIGWRSYRTQSLQSYEPSIWILPIIRANVPIAPKIWKRHLYHLKAVFRNSVDCLFVLEVSLVPRVSLLRLGLSSKVNPPLPHIGVWQASVCYYLYNGFVNASCVNFILKWTVVPWSRHVWHESWQWVSPTSEMLFWLVFYQWLSIVNLSFVFLVLNMVNLL